MIQNSKKALVSIGILAALTSLTAQGGGSSSDTTTYTLSSISSIKYGSVSNVETVEIKGTAFLSGPTTVVITNNSTSAAAARILAACYKNAQFSAANGGSIAFSHRNLNSTSSSGITGKLTGTTYTATFTENYPVSGETKSFSCEAQSSSGSSL